MQKLEIVSVNYNTPDLLFRLIHSIRKCTDTPIRICDGSDREPFITATKDCCNNYSGVTLIQKNWNIHHGPGMDYLLKTSTAKHCLVMDSDTELLPGLLECLNYTHPYEGFCCMVDRNGFNVYQGITYLHPELLLVDVSYYNKSPYKFIKHGAPAIEIMANIDEDDKLCIANERRDLYTRIGRGTCGRFGYQL